jgi:hypothetical protein
MGHTKVRCKKPLVAEEDGNGDGGFGGNGAAGAAAPADDNVGASWPVEETSEAVSEAVDATAAW